MQVQKITYDKSIKAILAEGKNVVDLSSVEDGTTAILSSRVAGEDGGGGETTFRFVPSEHFPFCLGSACLGPVTLMKAIVENKLQLKNLKCSHEIARIYRGVTSQIIDNILNQ